MNLLSRQLGLLSRQKLSVFLFHKVPSRTDTLTPYEMVLPVFERVLDFIDQHFKVIPLEDAVTALARGRLPAGAACITFDDGYPGWVDNVAPALQRRDLHATFFITSGQFDGEPMWHERVISALRQATVPALDIPGLGLPLLALGSEGERRTAIALVENYLKYFPLATRDELLTQIERAVGVDKAQVHCMSAHDLRQLHNIGFAIGGHTISHPILSLCDPALAMREIGGVRERLHGLIGGPVSAFAYPNGRPIVDFNADHVDMVRRAGYKCAVTTQWGGGSAASCPFQIPRFTPWGPDQLRMALQVGRNLMTRPRLISLPPAESVITEPWPARPVRVLLVENGAGFGGAVIALETLLASMSANEAECHIVANLDVGKFDGLAAVRSHRVIGDRIWNLRPLARRVARWRYRMASRPVLFALGRLDDLVNRLPYLVRFAWAAFRLRPDVIHGNNEPNSNREAMLVAKLLRKPYVQHVRGPLGESANAPWLLARPAAFVPVSRWLAGDLLRAGVPGERVRQIYDGVNIGVRRATGSGRALREELGIPAGRAVVAMVGMLVPWKGQSDFIEAARLLGERGERDVTFLVVGGLPERGDETYRETLLEQVGRAGLEDRLVFCGRRDDLPALLPEMDVVVSASTEPEPLGLVMLEAMVSGCMFVAPAFGAATEVVRDGINGFLFTPCSATSLADKIGEALGKFDERATITQNARDTVLGQFSAQACAEATTRLHRSLLQGAL